MSANAVLRVETGEQKEVVKSVMIWSGSTVVIRGDALSKTGFE